MATTWVQADLTEIERLIASGVSSAAHRDKRFAYRSLADLMAIRGTIRQALAGSARRAPAGFARHRKGLH